MTLQRGFREEHRRLRPVTLSALASDRTVYARRTEDPTSMTPGTVGIVIIGLLIIVTILSSLRMCSEWERKVVLRLGRFTGVRGPGIFFLLPYVAQTPFTIDTRVVTTS